MKTFFIILLSIMFLSNSVILSETFAQEHKKLISNDGQLEDYLYLIENRQDQSYRGPPTIYDAGISLSRVGEVDKKTGSYELDFWFWVTINEHDDPTDFTLEKPEFLFVNGKDITISSELIEPHYYEARIEGKFFNDFDFHDFPFEKINLVVEIESDNIEANNEHIVFVLDPESNVDESAKVTGWILEEFSISVVDHYYDLNDTTSQFVADFIIERSSISSILKNLLPIFLITGLSVSIFWVPENFTPRIYLTAPLLLALIYLHQSSLNSIPPLGYMTLFDKIMVVNYALFTNSILAIVVQMRLKTKSGGMDKPEQANKIMRYFIPIIIAIGSLFILVY